MARPNCKRPSCILGDARRTCHLGMPLVINLYQTRDLLLISQAFPPAKAIFTAVGVLLLVCTFLYVHVAHRNAITSQAAKNVRASEDALFEVFERLEAFFRRLEIYSEAEKRFKTLE